jgi:hypothetical protein
LSKHADIFSSCRNNTFKSSQINHLLNRYKKTLIPLVLHSPVVVVVVIIVVVDVIVVVNVVIDVAFIVITSVGVIVVKLTFFDKIVAVGIIMISTTQIAATIEKQMRRNFLF